MPMTENFKGVKPENFKEFKPEHLVKLARPGTGIANPTGDLALVPVSKYSLTEKK